MAANVKEWAFPVTIVLGGFAVVRLVCWATCVIFG